MRARLPASFVRGGTCAATFFLLKVKSISLIDSGRAHMPLTQEFDGCRVLDPKNPEADIGHKEATVEKVFAGAGLRVAETHYGSWCGRAEFRDYQDIVVARR